MKYAVRHATERDIEPVVQVLREASDWLRSKSVPMWDHGEISPDAVQRDISMFWLADDPSGSAAGVVLLKDHDDEFWRDIDAGESLFLHRLAVRRAHAHGQASTHLLDFTAVRAAALGKRFVRLDCAVDRPGLRRVYEKYGFAHHSDAVVGLFHVARYELEVGKRPNQALLPTPMSVTPRADARVAPATGAADL